MELVSPPSGPKAPATRRDLHKLQCGLVYLFLESCNFFKICINGCDALLHAFFKTKLLTYNCFCLKSHLTITSQQHNLDKTMCQRAFSRWHYLWMALYFSFWIWIILSVFHISFLFEGSFFLIVNLSLNVCSVFVQLMFRTKIYIISFFLLVASNMCCTSKHLLIRLYKFFFYTYHTGNYFSDLILLKRKFFRVWNSITLV